MNVRRVILSSMATLALALTGLALVGCLKSSAPRTPLAPGMVEVVGTLAAVDDDRPVDGGIDLTLETTGGVRELVRVPSSFTPEPREAILEMHAVVDAAKLGDRLRARGTRDESGALHPETLQLLR